MEEKQFDILNHINIQMSERNYRERRDASKHDSHQASPSPNLADCPCAKNTVVEATRFRNYSPNR